MNGPSRAVCQCAARNDPGAVVSPPFRVPHAHQPARCPDAAAPDSPLIISFPRPIGTRRSALPRLRTSPRIVRPSPCADSGLVGLRCAAMGSRRALFGKGIPGFSRDRPDSNGPIGNLPVRLPISLMVRVFVLDVARTSPARRPRIDRTSAEHRPDAIEHHRTSIDCNLWQRDETCQASPPMLPSRQRKF